MDELLTKPTKYNIEDSNIALLGSDLEKKVREHAGDKEQAWDNAGKEPGTQIWRIEKFHVKEWPKDKYGYFYDGDSYIVLHTYKKTPDAQELSYDLHFWIGGESSQDEAATAAYKTVELDDHLNGLPVEYREVQAFESKRFLSYFPHFTCQRGGIDTGFHHVLTPPSDGTKRFYRIIAHGTSVVVREVPVEGSSLVPGDEYVLDMGGKIWQLNTKGSVGKERFAAAEFVQHLAVERRGASDVTVFDEGGAGVGTFLAEIGLDAIPPPAPTGPSTKQPLLLFRLTESTGTITFEAVEPPTKASLSSDDAFLLDDSSHPASPAIYVWIGKNASLQEKRLAVHYAQRYLHQNRAGSREQVSVSIVKMREGNETPAFLRTLEA